MRNSSTNYNDLKKRKKTAQAGQRVSHSPIQSPTSLVSDENMDEGNATDEDDLEDGQETEMDTQSTQQALVEQKQK
jgi:hypothetical protein